MSLWNLFRRRPKNSLDTSNSVDPKKLTSNHVDSAENAADKSDRDLADEMILIAARRTGMSQTQLNELIEKYGDGTMRKIPEKDPSKTAWTAESIDQLIRDQRFELALEASDAVIRSAANSAEVHALKINALMYLARDEEAVLFGEESLVMWPTSVDLNCVLGLANNKLRRLDRAQQHFESALRENPLHMRSLIGLGDCFTFKGDFLQATVTCDRAIAIDPNDNMAWYSRAYALANLGEFAAALESVHRTIALWPQHPTARALKAKLDLMLAVGR